MFLGWVVLKIAETPLFYCIWSNALILLCLGLGIYFTILSTALFLPSVQSNRIALSVKIAFDIRVEITGGIITILRGLIIFGGVKRIGQVAEIKVPYMAGGYILMALII